MQRYRYEHKARFTRRNILKEHARIFAEDNRIHQLVRFEGDRLILKSAPSQCRGVYHICNVYVTSSLNSNVQLETLSTV